MKTDTDFLRAMQGDNSHHRSVPKRLEAAGVRLAFAGLASVIFPGTTPPVFRLTGLGVDAAAAL